MSLMVSEDQRMLGEIEKLVKKTIDRQTLDLPSTSSDRDVSKLPRERSGSRGDRSDRGESRNGYRGADRDRGSDAAMPPRAPAFTKRAPPADPIFSQPYESKSAPANPTSQSSTGTPSAPTGPVIAGIRRVPKTVPALLGGKPKDSD
jgi:hypothetical protein